MLVDSSHHLPVHHMIMSQEMLEKYCEILFQLLQCSYYSVSVNVASEYVPPSGTALLFGELVV